MLAAMHAGLVSGDGRRQGRPAESVTHDPDE